MSRKPISEIRDYLPAWRNTLDYTANINVSRRRKVGVGVRGRKRSNQVAWSGDNHNWLLGLRVDEPRPIEPLLYVQMVFIVADNSLTEWIGIAMRRWPVLRNAWRCIMGYVGRKTHDTDPVQLTPFGGRKRQRKWKVGYYRLAETFFQITRSSRHDVINIHWIRVEKITLKARKDR